MVIYDHSNKHMELTSGISFRQRISNYVELLTITFVGNEFIVFKCSYFSKDNSCI